MIVFFYPLTIILTVLLLTTSGVSADDAADLKAGMTAYREKEFQTAIHKLLPLAIEGNAEAQYQIGLMYDRGLGFPKDRCISITWADKAARQGHPNAAMQLAFSFTIGSPVRQSDEMAYRWASFANKLGHPKARDLLSFMAGELTTEERAIIDLDMETWDPSKLPAQEYFFIDGSALKPIEFYRDFVKNTGIKPCR